MEFRLPDEVLIEQRNLKKIGKKVGFYYFGRYATHTHTLDAPFYNNNILLPSV